MAKKYDNIELDMIDAERLGYGVHYGHFKVDYPLTKDAHGEKLKKKKPKPATRPIFTRTCPVCEKVFTTHTKSRVYCDIVCKERRDRKAYREQNAK